MGTPASFKPGQSGNPNGRPKKGYSITGYFREMFKANPEKKAELGNKIYEKAMDGDTTAIKLLWNYMDGLPKQDVNFQGELKVKPILAGVSQNAIPAHNSDEKVIDAE